MRIESKYGGTILTGEVKDQPHLFGILDRINGLGLLSVDQEAPLGCRLQEPGGGLAGGFAQRRLTKWSPERRESEVRRAIRVGTDRVPAGLISPATCSLRRRFRPRSLALPHPACYCGLVEHIRPKRLSSPLLGGVHSGACAPLFGTHVPSGTRVSDRLPRFPRYPSGRAVFPDPR
jgi:hypothetical protein